MGALSLSSFKNLDSYSAGRFAGSRPGGRVPFFGAKKGTKETCPAPSRASHGSLRCSFRPGLFRQHIPVQSEKASASMPRPFGLLTLTAFRCSARRTGGHCKGTLRVKQNLSVIPA